MSRKQVDPPTPGPSSQDLRPGQGTAPGRVEVDNLTPYDLDVQAVWTTNAARLIVRIVAPQRSHLRGQCTWSLDLGPVGWDDIVTCEREAEHEGPHRTSHPAGGESVHEHYRRNGWERASGVGEARR